MDLDFSFGEVDFWMAFQVITRCIGQVTVGKTTPLKRHGSSGTQASGSQASASQANSTLRQQAKEQLAIEDAKEKGKLLIKAEESVRGNAGIIFKAKKIAKALPPTVLANMHCKHLEELKVAMETYTAQLESITINGTMPDDSKPASMAIPKDVFNDSCACTKDLSQACLMAQSLLPK